MIKKNMNQQQRDRGHDWLLVPIIGLDSDYGLNIGGGIQLNRYNFREVPKEYMQQITASYATRFGNFAGAYEADFYSLVKSGRLKFAYCCNAAICYSLLWLRK